MSSAKSVAKEMVRLSLSGPLADSLTGYRLHCLMYYAQAWSLVLRDSELFPEEIECLDEGPIVSTILTGSEVGPAWQGLRPEFFEQEPNLDDQDEAVFLHHLWMAYGYLSPSGLFASIQEEAPFREAKKQRDLEAITKPLEVLKNKGSRRPEGTGFRGDHHEFPGKLGFRQTGDGGSRRV